MKFIYLYIFQFFSIVLFLIGECQASSIHPVLSIYKHYHTIKEKNYISPYITTIYALDLLKEGFAQEEVKSYITWYAKYANKIDKYGISGTAYDLIIDKNGTVHKLETYDSADGYAGLYLYLVAKYDQKYHDTAFLKSIWTTIADTVYLLLYLQDKDGLTKALADKDYTTKFLMDNIESHLGAKAYLYLAQSMHIDAKLYEGLKNTLKSAILHELYNTLLGEFYWVKEKNTSTLANKDILYPDIFIKIHLLAFWGNELQRTTTVKLWSDILKFFDKYNPAMTMEQLVIFNWAKTFAIKHNL